MDREVSKMARRGDLEGLGIRKITNLHIFYTL